MTKDGGGVRRTRRTQDRLDGLYTLGPGMEQPATNDDSIKQMKRLLKVAMEVSLTDRQRQVVQMHYIDGQRVVEIAAELGISRQAVHKLLKLSRRKLKKIKNIF